MTCVWLVRPELLTEMHIPDKLPKHIDQQLRKTAKRREQRQRAKQRAKDADTGMHKALQETQQPAAAAAAQLNSLTPAQLYPQASLPPQGTLNCPATAVCIQNHLPTNPAQRKLLCSPCID